MQSNTVVLNDIQQQVVQELDRNIVLLASAGTGKQIHCPIGWHISWKRDVPLEIKFCV